MIPALARRAWSVRALPRRVGWFYLRALRAARRADDRFSLDSAARPAELAVLIELARGRARVAEIGTGTGWTALAMALGHPGLRVLSYDPISRPERELYARLVDRGTRERVEFLEQGGEGASAEPVGMVFVDSSHEREETIATFHNWEPALAAGGAVVFHDYDHPAYPGVAEAVAQLGLRGRVEGGLFIWEKPL